MSLHHSHSTASLPFPSRAERENAPPLLRYLLTLVSIKKSNLAVSADVHSTQDLLSLAEDVGDHICILKTHADIIDDWSKDTITALQVISKRKHFLLFEDRKFGDIGNTLESQYTRGPLQIATWAHITNAHLLPGPGIVAVLHSAAEKTLTSMNQSVATTISSGTPRRSFENQPEKSTERNEVPSSGERDANKGEDKLRAGDKSTIPVPDHKEGQEDHLLFSHTRSLSGSVKATTTISQHYEQLSPSQTPSLIKTLSQGEDIDQQDVQSTLSELGPPPHARGLLLLAEMSSEGNLVTPEYTRTCVQAARSDPEFVLGFISQKSLNSNAGDNFVCMTPGVSLPPEGQEAMISGDGKGQKWRSPEEVVGKEGADIIIVGRGILKAEDRKREAQRYQQRAWRAYETRIGQ